MIKKSLIFIFSVVFSINCIFVYAASTSEYAEAKQLERAEIINCVTRHDCLIGIMKAAGLQVDNFFSNNYMAIEKIFFDDPAYDMEYLYIAEYTDVVIGVLDESRSSSWLNYYPNETATAKDCVSFIMRVIDSEADGKTDDELFERAKLCGLVKFEDSFYLNPGEALSYEKYYTLICRMLNEKRYLYFEYIENMDTATWFSMYSDSSFIKYDESGEMTYIDYLTSLCEINDSADEADVSEQIIKKLNIVNISNLNCLMAVTKIGGMRVEGLFEDSDICVSVMEKAGLKKEWLEYAEAYRFQSWNIPDYGAETTVFSMIYGILPNETEGEKTYYDYNKTELFCEKASVKDSISYILWFLTDTPDNMTSEEMYALAENVGIVEEADNVYENWEKRIDYSYFKTLIHRMLNAKRYIYFEEETDKEWFSAKKYDTSGKMTYFDYIREIYD